MRSKMFRSAGSAALLLLAFAPAAHATVIAPDYGAASTAVTDALTPVISTVLPIGAAFWAVLSGPRLLKKIVGMFTR